MQVSDVLSGAMKSVVGKRKKLRAVRDEAAHGGFASEEERLASFQRALDALRDEVDAQIGADDQAHLERIVRASRALEVAGRALIHFSLDPLTFGVGVASLSAHKALELMEVGHMALHGAYEKLPDSRFHAKSFTWKAPIDEKSWMLGHNVRHHQYTNIAGRDPDLDFGQLRLAGGIKYKPLHRLQPLTNVISWFAFANAINLHVSGMLDIYLDKREPAVLRDQSVDSKLAAHKAFLGKYLRYHAKEYVVFPLLAGPFFLKTLLGNVLSDMARDLYAGAIIYCGHVGATDFPADTKANGRGEWYAMQVEAAYNVDLPHLGSVLGGALDRQIEHHLFPRLPPNRLREIAPRVRAICEAHGVKYRSGRWPTRLKEVFRDLRKLSVADAA